MLITLKYGIFRYQLLLPLVKITSVLQITQWWENFCPWTSYSIDELNIFSFSNTYFLFAQNASCPSIFPPMYRFLAIFLAIPLVSLVSIHLKNMSLPWIVSLTHFALQFILLNLPSIHTLLRDHSHWFVCQLESKRNPRVSSLYFIHTVQKNSPPPESLQS